MTTDSPPKINVAAIPAELLERDQWVVWKWVTRKGDDKPTKPPFNARTTDLASSTDAATWATAQEAFDRLERTPVFDGGGFVVTADDEYLGFDFDHCVDATTGEIEPWALNIIRRLNSYTERTPSHDGARTWVKATHTGDGHKKNGRGDDGRGAIEVYDRGRYFTVTGHHIAGTPTEIHERQAEVDAILAELFPPKAKQAPPAPSRPSNLDDAAVLDKATNAKNGAKFRALWAGDASAYPDKSPDGVDHSSADSALCCLFAFYTKDEGQIDRLFRLSGLFRADRWDRAARAGETYGQRTITRAIELVTETYEPPIEIKFEPKADPPRDGDDGDETEMPDDAEEPAAADEEESKPDVSDIPEHLTDLGNAEFLIDRHGRDIRYAAGFGYFTWTGQRWQRDVDAVRVEYLAQRTVRSLYRAAYEELNDDRRKRIVDYAKKCESVKSLTAMVRIARSQPTIAIMPDQLDLDRLLLNVANGTLDLRTGTLRKHRRGDLITKIAPVAYDADAACPLFLKFLDAIFAGNQELIDFIQRAVGYALTGDVSERVLFVLYGSGRNGKSTLLSIIMHVLGEYARKAAPSVLMMRKFDEHPAEIAHLAGARFVAAIESEQGKRLAEASVKSRLATV